MNCERIEACPMFQQFAVKPTLGVWKAFYCEGNFDRCERYKVFKSGAKVAPTLLPNGRHFEGSIDQLKPRDLE